VRHCYAATGKAVAETITFVSQFGPLGADVLRTYCRGVFWDRKTKRWRCQLGYQSKKIFLGYFDDAGEAARAYDQKLVELRGAGGRIVWRYIWGGSAVLAAWSAVLELPHWWCRIGALQLLHGLMCSCGPLAKALPTHKGHVLRYASVFAASRIPMQ
jgi:hypothetical protein